MLEIYCYSTDCKFNDGKHKCRNKPVVNPAVDGDVPFSAMMGPLFVCNDYEEGDENGNDPR